MRHNAFPLATQDGLHLHVNHWHGDQPPRAVVMLSHGMAEHSLRYARLADSLVAAGFDLYALDQRGHGQSAAQGVLGHYAENAVLWPPNAEPVAGLAEDLAANWSTVLADERWADVAESLQRLTVPGAVTALAGDLGDAEAERLTAVLLQRWSGIGEPAPAPAAAIVGPDSAELTVVVEGLEPGWTANWRGPVEPVEPSGAVVRLTVEHSARVSVRVFGRTDTSAHHDNSGGQRTILTAEAVVAERHGPDGPGAAD